MSVPSAVPYLQGPEGVLPGLWACLLTCEMGVMAVLCSDTRAVMGLSGRQARRGA